MQPVCCQSELYFRTHLAGVKERGRAAGGPSSGSCLQSVEEEMRFRLGLGILRIGRGHSDSLWPGLSYRVDIQGYGEKDPELAFTSLCRD